MKVLRFVKQTISTDLAVDAVKSLLISGLDLTDEECMQIFISLYKHLVTTLNKMDMNPKVADDIIGVLLMEVHVCLVPT